jgi:4-azaleucine resistance transporter AzlC
MTVIFTWKGMVRGMSRGLPLALGSAASGLVFGVLAGKTGLSLFEATMMSMLVVAGASQFVVLGLWIAPLPVLSILVTTLVVNLRHVLMGIALNRRFVSLSPLKKYGSAFFLSDESWALTIGSFATGENDAAILPGSGFVLSFAWVGGTALGYNLGSLIGNPTTWGLSFAFPAACIALLPGQWRGKPSLLPWLVAVLVAAGTAHWLAGQWYILLGGLAGSLVGAFYDPA